MSDPQKQLVQELALSVRFPPSLLLSRLDSFDVVFRPVSDCTVGGQARARTTTSEADFEICALSAELFPIDYSAVKAFYRAMWNFSFRDQDQMFAVWREDDDLLAGFYTALSKLQEEKPTITTYGVRYNLEVETILSAAQAYGLEAQRIKDKYGNSHIQLVSDDDDYVFLVKDPDIQTHTLLIERT